MWWARYRLVGRTITIWKQSTNLICLMNIWNWSFNTDLLLCLWQLSHWPHFLLWSTMLLRSGKFKFLKYISEVFTTLVRPKPGFGIGNQNQAPIWVSIQELKLLFLKPKLYFSTFRKDISFHEIKKKTHLIFGIGALLWLKKCPLLTVIKFFLCDVVLVSVTVSAECISQFGFRYRT